MPASRWNTSVNEMLEWLREEERIDELLFTPIVTHNQDSEGSQSEFGNPGEGAESQIPSILPILPLRGLVVYPQTAVPLTIGQPRSIRLVDDVMSGDDRLIGLVSARNPDLETPEPQDLYSIGTVAIVHRLFRAPDGTIRLVVQGMARFRLIDFIQNEPYLKANVELIPETVEEGLELEALARNARATSSTISPR